LLYLTFFVVELDPNQQFALRARAKCRLVALAWRVGEVTG